MPLSSISQTPVETGEPVMEDRIRMIGVLTIVGGGRREACGWRRRRGKKLSACVARVAQQASPSTSPLDRASAHALCHPFCRPH
jgi:hypothetical protein